MGAHLLGLRRARQGAEAEANEPQALRHLKTQARILRRNQPGLRHFEALNQVARDEGYQDFHHARDAILKEAADAAQEVQREP